MAFASQHVRSIALVGHGAAGKTTLVESLLATAGAINSRGSIEKGNTVCDHDPLEKAWGHSLNTDLAHCCWQGTELQWLDAPGYPDFSGQALAALAAADTALIVVNAQAGIELATERMMAWAEARGLCRMIVINKIDADNVDLPALVAQLRTRFGVQCLLLDLPADNRHAVIDLLAHENGQADFASVAEAHRALIDQIVEEDESLLARYLDDGCDPSQDELHAPFEKALRDGHLIPILFVSAKTGAGIPELLDVLARLAPNPAEGNPPPFWRGTPDPANGVCAERFMAAFSAEPDASKHVLAHVFKVMIDPYVGKVGVFRVHQGTVRRDMSLFVGDSRRAFKVNHLYRLQGKDMTEVELLLPGELGAIAKVEELEFDCVLHDSHDEDHIHLKPLDFPRPMQGLAVETRRKGDEQRLFEVLGKLAAEDPCFQVERHPGSNETVIFGLGETHLRAKLARMAQQFKLELDTRPPRIPYRETITASSETTCRHKKQSGGAGQFGEVSLRVEPLPRGSGFEFVDTVKGGAIPGVFMPAVEKGVRQALADGVIAGYAVEDLRVTVFDGKTHAVDGKEIAFFTAGRKATAAAIRLAHPLVLEPVADLEILAPEAHIGDITGDLAARRGHVTGTSARGSLAAIEGKAPLSELSDYQSRLKSLTGGRGSYSLAYVQYVPAPPALQQQLTAQFRSDDDED